MKIPGISRPISQNKQKRKKTLSSLLDFDIVGCFKVILLKSYNF